MNLSPDRQLSVSRRVLRSIRVFNERSEVFAYTIPHKLPTIREVADETVDDTEGPCGAAGHERGSFATISEEAAEVAESRNRGISLGEGALGIDSPSEVAVAGCGATAEVASGSRRARSNTVADLADDDSEAAVIDPDRVCYNPAGVFMDMAITPLAGGGTADSDRATPPLPTPLALHHDEDEAQAEAEIMSADDLTAEEMATVFAQLGLGEYTPRPAAPAPASNAEGCSAEDIMREYGLG